MKSYVYILINHDKTMFKIGTTNNLQLRLKTLKSFWGEFKVWESFAIETSQNYSFKLESLLKNLVYDYRVKFPEDFKDKSGWTEFFKIEALEDLKDFINKSLLSFKKDLKLIEMKKFSENV